MLAQRYHKKMLKCNKKTIIIIKSTDISLDRQASSASNMVCKTTPSTQNKVIKN